ncbi:hypothetical protein DYE49_08875 [Treponema rectale]|uniref:Lipoprotein n=1 Tax=Treponema rectale TaxID=744512 RepID=A0A840SA71_9SPIR|nr:hypothetical protein [Treponema rectale]MBB5217704.1 hypothetical protein [Treponema rectale]QOS40567.1 hypothetical protein DYE49_08875 [Treponema rectale]
MKRFRAFLLNIFSVACVSIFVSCGFSVKDESNIEGSYGTVEVSVGNGARCVRPYAEDGVSYSLWFYNMQGKTAAEILKSVESADCDKRVYIESVSTSVTCALEAGSYLVYVKSGEYVSDSGYYFFQGHTVFSIGAGETDSFSVSVSPVSTSLDLSGNGYLSLTIPFNREDRLGTEAENYKFLLQVKNLETLEVAAEEQLVYSTETQVFTSSSSISLPAGLYYCSMYCLSENDTRVYDFFFKNDSCVEIVKGMTTVLNEELIVKTAELKRYVDNSSEYSGISSEYRACLSDCIKYYGTCGYAEFYMPEYDSGNYEESAIIDGTLISEESAFTVTQCMGGNSGFTGGMSVNLIITVKGRVITVKTESNDGYEYTGPVFILENAGDITVVSGGTGRELTTTALEDGSVKYSF